MTIYYSPRSVLKWLLWLFFILLVFNCVGIWLKLNYSNRLVTHISNATSFNSETSISTLYSSLILVTASILTYYINISVKKLNQGNASWLWLSIIFLYVSIDEFIEIHERTIMVFRSQFNLTGLLYYSWVIPYGILGLLLLFKFIPFLYKLEKKTRNLFLVSGFLFVLGAVGIELFGGRHHELYGQENIEYAMFYTIEESFEIIAISIFIYALLRYIALINPKSTFISRN